VAYEPQFTISPRLLSLVEGIAALRERTLGAAVEISWIPALQMHTRTRIGHASTAIEGNPLTLEQVRALALGWAEPGGRVLSDSRASGRSRSRTGMENGLRSSIQCQPVWKDGRWRCGPGNMT